jgi:hypothetical protein
MTQADFFRPATCDGLLRLIFFRLVVHELQLRHVPFDLAVLRAFLKACYPLMEPGDAPEVWATVFLQATAHQAGV